MSLYRRGDVWHYEFSRNGVRYRGSTGKRAKPDAQKVLRAKERAVDDELGAGPRRTPLTLKQAADKWYASRVRGQKTATTVLRRLGILFKHIDPDLPVDQIGAREVEDAMISRRLDVVRGDIKKNRDSKTPRHPSNSTVNRDIIDTTLRPILNYAEESLEEPVRRIKWKALRLKEPKARVRSFTPGELEAWREELPEWHRPLFDFIARYGVRLNEAFFSPSAINVEAGEITLKDTKNGTDHGLQILDDDMPGLAARKSRAEKAGLATVWFKEDDGDLSPIHWRAFQSASKLALRRSGLLDARPAHDLRHHAATELHRATGNLKLVQDLLNHHSIASSARYAHTNKADLRDALRKTYPTKSTPKAGSEQKSPVESKSRRVT